MSYQQPDQQPTGQPVTQASPYEQGQAPDSKTPANQMVATQPPMQSPPVVAVQAQQTYPQDQVPPPQYSQGQNVHSQEWTAKLCDCGPLESCLLATCIPCFLVGKTSERIRDPSLRTYEPINSDCLIFSLINIFGGCGWIYIMLKRSEIRQRFGIAGSGGSDCCTSYCCPCCAIIQQDNEVKNRLRAGPVQQGYQLNQGMQMPGR